MPDRHDGRDRLALLHQLRQRLERRRRLPTATASDSAHHNAWRAIVSRRVGPMTRRLERLARDENWEFDPGSKIAQRLRPAHWGAAARELIGMHDDLSAMLADYEGSAVCRARELADLASDRALFREFVNLLESSEESALRARLSRLAAGTPDHAEAAALLGLWAARLRELRALL